MFKSNKLGKDDRGGTSVKYVLAFAVVICFVVSLASLISLVVEATGYSSTAVNDAGETETAETEAAEKDDAAEEPEEPETADLAESNVTEYTAEDFSLSWAQAYANGEDTALTFLVEGPKGADMSYIVRANEPASGESFTCANVNAKCGEVVTATLRGLETGEKYGLALIAFYDDEVVLNEVFVGTVIAEQEEQ